MKKITIIPELYADLVNSIKNTSYYLAERPLVDHIDYINYNRKLVVSGLNIPDLEDACDKRIFISLRQILVNKYTGDIYKKFPSFLIEISADNTTFLLEPFNPNSFAKVDYQDVDGEGKIIKSYKDRLSVNSIDYTKSLIKNKNLHLMDILEIFLKDYIDKNKEYLDKI